LRGRRREEAQQRGAQRSAPGSARSRHTAPALPPLNLPSIPFPSPPSSHRSGLSVVSIIANTLLLTVAAAFVWNNVAAFAGRSSGFPVPAFLKTGISDAQARSAADAAAVYLNRGLAFAYRLVAGRDVVVAAQAAAALWLVGRVASWFTSLGLIFVAAVLAFSGPKLYELRKADIDGAVAAAASQGKAHYAKFVQPYVAKLPRPTVSGGAAGAGVPAPATAAAGGEAKKTS
jgi:hypothetical protein